MDKRKAKIVTGIVFALLVSVMYFIVTADTTIGIVLLSGFGLYGLISMGGDFMLWLQKDATQKPAHKATRPTFFDGKWAATKQEVD